MLLCFDIGNTHINCAFINEKSGEVEFETRIATRKEITEDEIFSVLYNACTIREVDIEKIKFVVVSSVVKELDEVMIFFTKKYFSINPLFVNADLKLPFEFGTPNKYETGADRLSNLAGAAALFPWKNICIIDLGTATTFEIIKENKFIGGFILPGIGLMAKSLFNGTSKLPHIKVSSSARKIGSTTAENINNGIYFGYVGQIKELLSIVRCEVPDIITVATGGMAEMIRNDIHIDHYIPELAFEGMRKIYGMNKSRQ